MAGRAIAAGILFFWAASGALGQSAPVSLADQYQAMLKTADANSADDHYRLGEWAYKNGLNDVALKELQAALALQPGHLRASILIKDVQAKAGKGGPVTPGPGEKEANAVGTGVAREWLLPDDDVYHIRLEELRPEERGLPIQFRNNVIERFIKKWRGREEFRAFGFEDTFRAWSPAQQVAFMREKNPDDTDIKDDILVQNDPRALTDFRQRIWPIIASSCATASCHGSGDPKGGLRLFSVGGRNDRIDDTNFALFDGFVSRGRRMVDRSTPDVSLILQFMLPEDLAQFRHPVPIQPAVGRRAEAKYVTMLEWIRSLHKPPHPDYRLSYKPPMGMKIVGPQEPQLPPPGTAPAPAPASAPATRP
jgi:hypothetical protein